MKIYPLGDLKYILEQNFSLVDIGDIHLNSTGSFCQHMCQLRTPL